MLTYISLLVTLQIKGLIIWKSKCHQNPQVLSDGYVKYEEAEVRRSGIMQDFRDNEKKIEMADWRPFWILYLKFVMGYPCVRHYILFYILVQLFCIFLR